MEPRILFSADLAAALGGAFLPQAETRVIGSDGEFSNFSQGAVQAQHARLEVVFIDTQVQGYEQFLSDIQEQNAAGDENRTLHVVMLDAEQDGIQQISDYLKGQHNLDAVHIISHGTDGSVQLGNTNLNLASLTQNAAQIEAWGNALSSDADILLYGCDVAQQADGRSLADALARVTGADVAASDNLTGSAGQGGDWVLEYNTGVIQAQVAVNEYGQMNWQGLLATLSQRIASASDDAEEEGPTGTTPNKMWLNSTDIELVSDFGVPTAGVAEGRTPFYGNEYSCRCDHYQRVPRLSSHCC